MNFSRIEVTPGRNLDLMLREIGCKEVRNRDMEAASVCA